MRHPLAATASIVALVAAVLIATGAVGLAATSTTLYLYDTGEAIEQMGTTFPSSFGSGRLIEAGGSGATETDPSRQQTWLATDDDVVISGSPRLVFWGAAVGTTAAVDLVVSAHLLDCDSFGGTCSEISTATRLFPDWWTGYGHLAQQSIDFGAVDHTITDDRRLGLKLTVDAASEGDLWIYYGTAIRPSHLEVSTAAVPSTTTVTPATTTTTFVSDTSTSASSTTSTTMASTPSPSTTSSTLAPSKTPVPGTTVTTVDAVTTPTTTTTTWVTTTTGAPAPQPSPSPPTTIVYATPTSIAEPPLSPTSTATTTSAPPVTSDTRDDEAPVLVASGIGGSSDPGPDQGAPADENPTQPAGTTFLLTPDRRNGGLTPTRVLGVVFHLIVENLDFNLLPAVLLGGITAWFTMKGVRPQDAADEDELGAGWVT